MQPSNEQSENQPQRVSFSHEKLDFEQVEELIDCHKIIGEPVEEKQTKIT